MDRYENWDNVDHSDDEVDEEDFSNTKDATLFLIESTDSMLEPNLNLSSTSSPINSIAYQGNPPKSKMEICLRAAYAMSKRKIISSPKDLFGILIFNTMDSTDLGTSHLKGNRLLFDLKQLTAETLKGMKEHLKKSEEQDDYLKEYLKPDNNMNSNIVETLKHVGGIFNARAGKLSSKRIILITDRDNPVNGNTHLTSVAKLRKDDLKQMGVIFETYFVPSSSEEPFDVDLFYKTVFANEEDADDEGVDDEGIDLIVHEDLNTALEVMVATLRSKETVKRTAFSIPFFISEGVTIGVNGYATVIETKKRDPVKYNPDYEGGTVVLSKTSYTDADSAGAPLNVLTETKKYFEFGHTNVERGVQSRKIMLDEDSLRKIKTLGTPPGLKLLGFVSKAKGLKFNDFVKHSYFIYPDEQQYLGSIRTFAALLRGMLKKDKVAYAWFLSRPNGTPRVVVLLPQAEELDERGVLLRSNGMYVIQLPFADDVRGHTAEPIPGVVDADSMECEPIDVAKEIIKKYTVREYLPDQFPNPALNFFHDTLAAHALDEPPPIQTDNTIPNYETMDRLIGDQLAHMKTLIREDQVDTSKMTASKHKRPITRDPHLPPPDVQEFVELYKEHLKNGTLKKLTVDIIKSALRLMEESVSGRRDDLLTRALEYCGKHGFLAEDRSDDESEEHKAKRERKEKKKRDSEKGKGKGKAVDSDLEMDYE